MKQNLFKCLPLAFSALLFGSAVQAQDKPAAANQMSTWSIGANLGVLSPISPLGGKNDFSNWKSSLGYGLYVKKQFTPYFSLRLDGVAGKLKGDNTEPFDGGTTNASPVSALRPRFLIQEV